MKTIHLIRHAETNIKNYKSTDYLRCLNDSGLLEANLIAKKLSELDCNPDYILCSSAKRTTETALIIAKKLKFDEKQIIFDQYLYNATVKQLIEAINNIPNTFNNLALISHNPAISETSNYLTDDFIDHLPTCGVVKIELNVDNWKHIIQGIGNIEFFIYPKMF